MIIYFDAPDGRVAVVKEKIVAIIECHVKNDHGIIVKAQIYVDGDNQPFNSYTDFDEISKALEF